MTPSIQSLPFSDLPEGASPPQKVSRVLTGYEGLLFSYLVRSIILHPVKALPISLEYDGVMVLVRRNDVKELFDSIEADLNSFSLGILGCVMPLYKTVY